LRLRNQRISVKIVLPVSLSGGARFTYWRRLLVKNVRGSLAVFDYDGKLLFINDIGADMVGKKPEDIVGLTQWDIFPKEVADVQIENIRRVIDTGDIYYEKAKTFINNQWRHYDVSVQPYLDYEGNTIAALIVAYDATKRVDAEKGVREKEENYRILFESSPDSILIVDFEGTIIDCNRASESISGEPPEQAIGKTIFDFGGLPEEETERLLQFLEKARHGEIIRPITIKFWMSGELRWLTIYPTLLERDGVAVAIQAIIRDITERKKTEIALKDSEQRYRDLVEKADIAILIDNAEGGLIYFNNKLCQLFGYTHEEMIKQTIKTLVHPEDYDLVKSYHDRRFSGEESPGRYEFRGIRRILAEQGRGNNRYPFFYPGYNGTTPGRRCRATERTIQPGGNRKFASGYFCQKPYRPAIELQFGLETVMGSQHRGHKKAIIQGQERIQV